MATGGGAQLKFATVFRSLVWREASRRSRRREYSSGKLSKSATRTRAQAVTAPVSLAECKKLAGAAAQEPALPLAGRSRQAVANLAANWSIARRASAHGSSEAEPWTSVGAKWR